VSRQPEFRDHGCPYCHGDPLPCESCRGSGIGYPVSGTCRGCRGSGTSGDVCPVCEGEHVITTAQLEDVCRWAMEQVIGRIDYRREKKR